MGLGVIIPNIANSPRNVPSAPHVHATSYNAIIPYTPLVLRIDYFRILTRAQTVLTVEIVLRQTKLLPASNYNSNSPTLTYRADSESFPYFYFCWVFCHCVDSY